MQRGPAAPQWWVGRFSRLSDEAVLTNPTRKVILEFVNRRGATTFGELRRELHLGSGSLAHHLAILEGRRLVTVIHQPHRRVYLIPSLERPPPRLMDSRTAVMNAIAARSGITMAELQEALGLSRGTLRHHLQFLVDAGEVRRVGGRPRQYHPSKTVRMAKRYNVFLRGARTFN